MTGRGLLLAVAGYFVAVLAGAVVCGYVLVLRRQTGLGAWVAGVLKRIGEPVSRRETRAELIRRRLQAAGYRTLSSLHLLYGIKCASAGLLGLLCASLAV